MRRVLINKRRRRDGYAGRRHQPFSCFCLIRCFAVDIFGCVDVSGRCLFDDAGQRVARAAGRVLSNGHAVAVRRRGKSSAYRAMRRVSQLSNASFCQCRCQPI